MDPVKTGRLISEARSERGLSQQKLAEELHLTRTTVSKWENGRGLPDISVLEPLSQALGLTVAELIHGGREAKEEPEVTVHEVISLSNRKQTRSRTAILALAALSMVLVFLIIAIVIPNERYVDCGSMQEAAEIAGFTLGYSDFYVNTFPSGAAVSRSWRAKKGALQLCMTVGVGERESTIRVTKGVGDKGLIPPAKDLVFIRHEDSHSLSDGNGGWTYTAEDISVYGRDEKHFSLLTWRAGGYSYTYMYEPQWGSMDWYSIYMLMTTFR